MIAMLAALLALGAPEERPARRPAVTVSGAIESAKLWPGKPHPAFGVGVDLPGDRTAGGGFHLQPFHMNQIDVSQIRGIEIYRSFAELPVEFKEGLYMTYAWPTGRMGGCGFAVIWTAIGW